jgi:mycoredoxin
MKKLIVLVLLGALYQHWPSVKLWLQPPSMRGTPQVVLYATHWCGYCAKARQQLSSDGVPYREIDIERDAAGNAQYQALGGRGIPLLQINGKLIHGFDPNAMRAAY